MLAMVVNDKAGYLNTRVVRAFFASMLAPTGRHDQRRSVALVPMDDHPGRVCG
jgi:hypothetical protein